MSDDEVEETVILTRRDRRRAGAASDAAPPVAEVASDDADDAIDDATVVVDRSAPPAAEVVDDATVAVARPARRLRRKKGAVADGDGTAPRAAGPRLRVDSFAAPDGAPAPAIYKPRPAPRTPVAPPVIVGAAAPTRVVEPGLPSVAKQAQRWSVVTLAATLGAGVVSVVGLVALGFVVFA